MLRFFPFGELFEAGMGARALGPSEALIDIELPRYTAEIALKRRLLSEAPHEYFSGGTELLAAQWDVLKLVLTDLSNHYPDFRLEQRGHTWYWYNPLLGETQTLVWDKPESLPLEPLDWVGRQVQEDLVLVSADATAAFVGGQLCFPNGWAIADRLGRPFMTIHERTPQTTMPSVHAGARLPSAMKPGKTLWRLSWNFKLTDQLDLSTKHKPRHKAEFAALVPRLSTETIGRKVFIRIERQTLTRLPLSPYVLFGIHTYNSRLDEEVADPERARRMLQVIEGAPDEVKRYKAILPIEHVLTDYLRSRVARQ